MRLGLFPGQEEALRERLREIREEGVRRGRRRLLVGLAAGGLLGACWAAWAGSGWPPADADLRARAQAPLEELVETAGTFLTEVARTRPCSRASWIGVARLAAAVADGRVDPEPARKIRTLILTLSKRRDAPPFVRPWIERLRPR